MDQCTNTMHKMHPHHLLLFKHGARTILRSTSTPAIDRVASMIRIKRLRVDTVVLLVVLIAIVVYALIIKAYFFVRIDIPSSKYSKKRFLDIAFVDVACIQSTIWITGMIQERVKLPAWKASTVNLTPQSGFPSLRWWKSMSNRYVRPILLYLIPRS